MKSCANCYSSIASETNYCFELNIALDLLPTHE